MLVISAIATLFVGLLLHNIIIQYQIVHNFASSWKICTELHVDLKRIQQDLSPNNSIVNTLTEEFLPDAWSENACQEGQLKRNILLISNKNSRYALWFCATQRFNTCSGALSPQTVIAIVSL